MTYLRYFSPDVTVLTGEAFLPNFQTKLKYDKISIYLVKITELCINKYFIHVKTLHVVLNPIKLACCGSQKDIPVTPSGTLTHMTDLIYFSVDVTVYWGGGGFSAKLSDKLKIV